MKGQAIVLRCLLALMAIFVSESISAQSILKHWGLRAGGNYSNLKVMSGEHSSISKLGGQIGVIYVEEYFYTGFDLESFFAFRQSGVDSLKEDITLPQLGLAGRFRIYTSSRKHLSFHLGYQLNLSFVDENSDLERLTTGPELGLAYNITERWAIETSAFFPASKSGEISWKTEQTTDEVTEMVQRKEDIYLFSILLSVRYKLFERY